MFGWLKAKPANSPLLLPLDLDNHSFVSVVSSSTIVEPPNAGCMCIVAYQLLGTLISVANNPALQAQANFPRSADDFIRFIVDSLPCVNEEPEKRRLMWLYQAALIMRASRLSASDPSVLDEVARIWVHLARCSPYLHSALKNNVLWSAEEKEFLRTIDNERDALSFVLAFLAPQNIREHEAVRDFAAENGLFMLR